MRSDELLRWIAALPALDRDARVERYLGLAPDTPAEPPGQHLIGYHASGVAPIVHALAEAAVTAGDTVIDLGAGLGKVVLLAHLLTGAHARGIELQGALVEKARAAASRLGAEVTFVQGDVRDADLQDGTVFYLYAPFTGPVLAEVLDRLRAVAQLRSIVVCALGIDAGREAPWLLPRPLDSFWLTLYDSAIPGVPPRPPRASPLDPETASRISLGR